MERTQVLDLMSTLKLYGMRSAYDEVMGNGIKRQHEPPRIVGDLLQSEIAEKQARSIRYQLSIAKLPLAKDIDDFEFANTPVNEGLVRELAAGTFVADQRNVVLVGGTGTGKSHLAIAVARALIRNGTRGRFFNVVGPRQSGAYGMVLPRFVDAALAGQPLVVHDDGRQVRCFAHVREVVSAVVQLMESPAAAGHVYNIGSDQPVTILELAQRVVALAGSNSPIEFQSYAQAYDQDFEDIRHRVPDLTRLKQTIGFAPRGDLDAIVRDVIDHRRGLQQTGN